ncbi:glucose-mannose-6-phosphate isomerase protein [Marine Group I thaumarchaeote SCGC RSA3]|uniref:Glucose-mannose-6-phosphate isomerase protein n=2 Tax=Marine Group I TaxID=905826 RepID=A0A087RM42_9ARCH|nr:glucose-mannose-6-phosphate isomerase protein [Marine Group I thaumarchaeote SCGC AAA799-D11]KFM19940.1 glucose-mannose-6-phosphate isomerase protein [Marine Group I thaumarchaeote SCGC RSA3]
MDLPTLEKFDSKGMHKVYDMWPQIARESFESDQNQVEFDGINHIVFAGMGGSGAIGDIIASILSKTNIHTSVIKGYLLPKTVDSKTLVISTSVSGNTQEILSTLKLSNDIGCKIVAFSSGGKIKDYAIKNKIEFREISQIHSPRASFVSFLFSMLKVLSPIIPLKTDDVYESIKELEIQSKKISSENLNQDNPALSMAEWIIGIPLIYYPSGLQAAAIRFKNSLQENVKMHAITEDVIEACHNGIVAWEKSSNVQPILLEGKDDYVKTKERWNVIKDYFDENKIDFKEVNSVNGSILSKLVNLIYFLDYTSIYKAVISNIDPSPVKSIDFIKKKINE